jgi:hypothetical protein
MVALSQARECTFIMLDEFLYGTPTGNEITTLVCYRNIVESMWSLLFKDIAINAVSLDLCYSVLLRNIFLIVTLDEAIVELVIPYVDIPLFLAIVIIISICTCEYREFTRAVGIMRIEDITIEV